jgi:chorismate synthase
MEDFSIKGRHDLCVALRAPVILEAATAVALVDYDVIRTTHSPHLEIRIFISPSALLL